MTRPLTSNQRGVGPAVLLALLMSLTLIPRTGFGEPPAPAAFLTPSLEAVANALADSMEARCAAGFVRILDARGNDIRIDRGSSGGLRPFTRDTLSRPGAPAWKAEVASLTEEATWLKPAVPGAPGPAVGTTARIRLDIGRLAMSQPATGNAARTDIGLALAWHDRLAHIVQAAANIATAASTALPPCWKIIEPAVAARGLPVTATQCLPCSWGRSVRWAERASGANARTRISERMVRMVRGRSAGKRW